MEMWEVVNWGGTNLERQSRAWDLLLLSPMLGFLAL